ncbi:hypothetical protein SAMN05421505_12538 [Sinosporangium album]|uniref:Uncharacterized protein n=1 Tax=Sinosporangium album TaxID=504805 RepID=A0A1G8G102_9ACTN|nr:hypothetical protein [Sinosporangium album]SDH88087.1 hypothetical protein SAMN05421505_12538 [Sinosporangium album]
MWLFRRRRERQAPRRAAEDVDLDSLLALVAETLGYTCAFAADGSSLALSAEDGTRHAVRLTGLRREAAKRAREDWPTLVSAHLAHVVATAGEPLDAAELEQIRPLLRTRVQLADDIPDLGRVVGRHLSSDLVELLTVGYGGAVRAVRPEEAGCWPLPSGEVLDLALTNARHDERLTAEEADLSGVPVWRLSGSTAGAAAHLRWLEEYLPVPDDGALVAFPSSATMIVHLVRGIGVVRAIERLRLYAQKEYDGEGDAVSPQIYWWCDGRLTLIKADLVGGDGRIRLVVAPSREFARVLADIATRGD